MLLILLGVPVAALLGLVVGVIIFRRDPDRGDQARYRGALAGIGAFAAGCAAIAVAMVSRGDQMLAVAPALGAAILALSIRAFRRGQRPGGER